MKRQPVRVEVVDAPQPIDIEQWAETVLRIILPLNGVTVRPVVASDTEPMRKAS